MPTLHLTAVEAETVLWSDDESQIVAICRAALRHALADDEALQLVDPVREDEPRPVDSMTRHEPRRITGGPGKITRNF
jgi:hypothetical protein